MYFSWTFESFHLILFDCHEGTSLNQPSFDHANSSSLKSSSWSSTPWTTETVGRCLVLSRGPIQLNLKAYPYKIIWCCMQMQYSQIYLHYSPWVFSFDWIVLLHRKYNYNILLGWRGNSSRAMRFYTLRVARGWWKQSHQWASWSGARGQSSTSWSRGSR